MQISGTWKLKDFAPGEGLTLGAQTESHAAQDWVDVVVPGDVHQALIAAGRIPDPFYDRNELECAWMEAREWWYRSRFRYEADPLEADERLRIVFHGLDTYASIWLNGEQLGRHANMFREAVFDVSQIVRTDATNTLVLCFEPPQRQVSDKKPLGWPGRPVGAHNRNHMRKAQFGYGWDWGPRLPTIGIWRPVELRRQRKAAIHGVHFYTETIEPDRKRAQLSIKVEAERFSGDELLEAEITLTEPGKTKPILNTSLTLTEHDNQQVGRASLSLDEPRLWWTHDLGEPYLYTLRVNLLDPNGTQLDRSEEQVGVRTLELDQSPDEDGPGHLFRFVLNGVPIFARGANWIPASSFVGGVTADRYERLIEKACAANMNMLRIWGGGIYEHDAFYQTCNRFGILIWQDFMFSCAPYPEDDPDFVAEVRKEVRYQIRRLRNHPCLALWCGNNENQMIHHLVSLVEEQGPLPGLLYYDEIMPEAVRELDGVIPYWPGSPEGGPYPNSMEAGDVHDWHVWHGLPIPEKDAAEALKREGGPTPEDVSFVHYAEDTGRFISEFGMHASPVLETLRRCIPPDQLYHHSPSMDHHNKDNPKDKGDRLMQTVTGVPKNLEEFIDFSMISQAEGLKFGIEHFRRRKPHCSGTLLWQYNDCWPVQSWSILDYYGFGKAGYFYVKRAFAPVLASFRRSGQGVELWITNDRLVPMNDEIVIQHGSFAEGTIWEQQIQARVPANSSQLVWQAGLDRVHAQPDRYLTVRSRVACFPANRLFFAPIKDLQRPIVTPEVSIESHGDHELRALVRASGYVYYLYFTVPDEHTHFSDNYFDLAAGESMTVVITNETIQLTPDLVSVGWK